MQITKKHLTSNFSQNANPTRGFMFHVDLGTEKGTHDWLSNPTTSASYHWYITRDGRILEYVRPTDGAWHAGRAKNPTKRVTDRLNGLSGNKGFFSVCYEGRGVDRNGHIVHILDADDWGRVVDGQKPTMRQVRAAAWLVEQFPKQKEFICSHKEYKSTKPACVDEFVGLVQDERTKGEDDHGDDALIHIERLQRIHASKPAIVRLLEYIKSLIIQ